MQGDMKISGIIEAARTTAENASLKPLDPNADLREAAEQFEAIFINQFLAQSRKTKLAEDLLACWTKSSECMCLFISPVPLFR